MPNQWRRLPNGGRDLKVLVFWIAAIIIIGYLLFPNLYKGIYSFINPAVSDTSFNTGNFPSSSSSSSIQNYLNGSNTGNDITTGYWILSGSSDGTIKKFSVSSDSYAFLQGLIQSDSKGNAQNTIFMIDNGQISQYTVSNEIYSIVSDLAAIDGRTSNAASSTTPNTSSSTTPNSSSSTTPNASSSTTPNVSSNTTPSVSPTSP